MATAAAEGEQLDAMVKTFSVEAALRHRYRAPEFAILFEVRNRTGFSGNVRSADAIAMSLYPSRGLEIIGFEIKRSRGDWMTELRDPDKSAAIQKYCDRWYVTVSDESIVQNGELPKTWGLLIPRGSKLICKVEAPQLAASAVDRTFLASLMRNANVNSVDAKTISGAVEIERERIRKEFSERREEDKRSQNRTIFDLQDKIKRFEEASGVSLQRSWDSGNIGTAVKFVKEGGIEQRRKELESLAQSAEVILNQIRATLADNPKLTDNPQNVSVE